MAFRRLFLFAALFLAACSAVTEPSKPPAAVGHEKGEEVKSTAPVPADTAVPLEPTVSEPVRPEPAPAETAPAINRRVEMAEISNYPHLLPFDGIMPIYDPQFAGAVDAPLTDDELVLGIALGGEAKAYPISVLRFREMVNDEMSGIPTLVTW